MADTTTRYGWPYQEGSDPPDGANLGQDLAEAIEATVGDLEDATNLGAWTTYTPVFSTPSGSPSVGTGGVAALTGRHKKIGRLVTVSGILRFGTTGASGGTGGYRLSLPFTAATVTDQAWVGSCYVNDTSAGASGHFNGSCVVASGGTYAEFYAGSAGAQVSGAAPMTWNPGDSIRFEVTYESAA